MIAPAKIQKPLRVRRCLNDLTKRRSSHQTSDSDFLIVILGQTDPFDSDPIEPVACAFDGDPLAEQILRTGVGIERVNAAIIDLENETAIRGHQAAGKPVACSVGHEAQ